MEQFDGPDVLIDADHRRPILAGMTPLQRSSSYEAWFSLQQQLTGRAENGKSVSGTSMFLNVTQADRLTWVTDNQVALGLFYKGLVPRLPGELLGLGLARSNVNGRAVLGGTVPSAPGGIDANEPDAEYMGKLYYSLQPTKWLELRPNLQAVHQPGRRDGQRRGAGLESGTDAVEKRHLYASYGGRRTERLGPTI